MSVILERPGHTPRVVPADASWSVAAFAAEVHAALGLRCAVEALRFEVAGAGEGFDASTEGCLAAVGIHGVEEVVHVDIPFACVAAATLAADGLSPSAADLTAAVQRGDRTRVRLLVASNSIPDEGVTEAVYIAAKTDQLDLFDSMPVYATAYEDAFMMAVDDSAADAYQRLIESGRLDLAVEDLLILVWQYYDENPEWTEATLRALFHHGRNAQEALLMSDFEPRMLQYAEGHCADRAFVLKAVAQFPTSLQWAAPALRADREVVMAAVQRAGGALEHASDALKADVDVVTAALREDYGAARYAAPEMLRDRDVVLKLVRVCCLVLEHVDAALRADRDVVYAAVKSGGWALQYAAEALRNDRELVRLAVRYTASVLTYVTDPAVLEEAVRESGYGLQYVGQDLRSNRDVVLAAVAEAGFALQWASPELRDDRDVVLAAIGWNPTSIQYASERLQRELRK